MELTKLAISRNPISITCKNNILVIAKITGIEYQHRPIDYARLLEIINDKAQQNQWRKTEEIKKCGPFTLPVECISYRTANGDIFSIKPKLRKLTYQNVEGIHFYSIDAEVILN